MKSKPMLFQPEMICALQREIDQPGTGKTQTRRIVKPQPQMVTDKTIEVWEGSAAALKVLLERNGRPCPYGRPGDLLWVRETWGIEFTDGIGEELVYRSDGELDREWLRHGRWRPSIHMPRRLSRYTLLLTDVRVERVREISEEDAMAEGAAPSFTTDGGTLVSQPRYRYGFRDLWASIHGTAAWSLNDWAWALTFRPIAANVDAVLADPAAYGIREAA